MSEPNPRKRALASAFGAQTIDPAAVRLVGHVTDRPPLHGTLLHRGWRAARVELPPLGDPAGRTVIAQAEIEAA